MSGPLEATPVFKPLVARGKALGQGGNPAVCVPLVGSRRESILEELGVVLGLCPDIIEWRADCLERFESVEAVLEIAAVIRDRSGDTPVIFTWRSTREGGSGTLDEPTALRLTEVVADSGLVDFVDVELDAPADAVCKVIAIAKLKGAQVIVSSHDFSATPSNEAILARLQRAQALGGDVAKIAVTPHDSTDVSRLLEVTWKARQELDLPLVTMAMGPLGLVTRAFGHLLGSSLSFAAGVSASAPGQIAVADLRSLFDIVTAKNPPR